VSEGSRWTPAERDFLLGQRLARVASVGPTGWPHVMPVMFTLVDADAFEFDADGVKLRNLEHEPRAALVVDGMGPKRGISVQGRTRVIGPERVRLEPERHFSWGF
jgi:hypothetical protein